MSQIKLSVQGMSCENCANHVTEALEKVPGVTKVTVSLRDNTAEVELRADAGDVTPQLLQAVEQAGYQAQVVS